MRAPKLWKLADSSEGNGAVRSLRAPVVFRATIAASRIRFAAVMVPNSSTSWPIPSHRIGHYDVSILYRVDIRVKLWKMSVENSDQGYDTGMWERFRGSPVVVLDRLKLRCY
jgi:hypothetical protein